jgi:hypothetical protein
MNATPKSEDSDWDHLSGKDISWRYCALEYTPQSIGDAAGPTALTILLVLRDEQGGLRFFIHPELRNIFDGQDLEYLDSLVSDFMERGKEHPAELFEQLCSLGGVGPLATKECGADLSDSPSLSRLSECFVEL